MTQEWYLNDKGEGVAKRAYGFENLLTSLPLEDVPDNWGMGIGQDGYSYMVGGDFSHPYIEHTVHRDSRGELWLGCAYARNPEYPKSCCGWSETIHNPGIKFVHCDFCDETVFYLQMVEVSLFDTYKPHETTLPESMGGGAFKSQLKVRHRHYFCTITCLKDWLEKYKGDGTE